MISLAVNHQNVAVSRTVFPAGEVGVSLDVMGLKKALNGSTMIEVAIHTQGYEPNMLITIMQIKEALNQFFLPYMVKPRYVLMLAYMPFSRYDRHMYRGDAFGLKVFAQVINSMNFDMVVTLDAHSDVTAAVINNLYNIPQVDALMTHRFLRDYDVVVAPDAGAEKKATAAAKAMQCELATLVKHRNVMTGEITGMGLSTGIVKNQNCLIVDDLCDGGATFVHAAAKLFTLGAKSVDLYVTHGVFSKGTEVLRNAGIENIYTTNSFEQEGNGVNFVGYGSLI